MYVPEYPKYEPSILVRKYELTSFPDLARLVYVANKDGLKVYVDWLEGNELEEVTSQTVNYAVHEAELSNLVFVRDNKSVGTVAVITGNGDDWLSDYTLGLQELVEHCLQSVHDFFGPSLPELTARSEAANKPLQLPDEWSDEHMAEVVRDIAYRGEEKYADILYEAADRIDGGEE